MNESLASVIKEVNKKFKSELVTVGTKEYAYTRIPFSSPKLNYMTYGGVPLACIAEFSGLESSGKTSTAFDVVANAQKLFAKEDKGRKVVYVDVENSFDTSWAKKLGVDTDDLILFSPKNESAEDILNAVIDFINSGEVGMVVVDSIAALLSDSEFEGDLNSQQYGGISKVLTKFSKKASLAAASNNCLLLCINQNRDNLNSMYGGLTTPGGHAFKYMCTLRMSFQHGKFIDDKGAELSNNAENPFGNIINVKLEKTKCCAPNRRSGHYTLRYDTGVDYVSDLMEMGQLYGIVQQAGAWYNVIDTETGELMQIEGKDLKFQGKAKIISALKESPEFLNMLMDKVNNLMYADNNC